jgi:hypothetical protein
LYTTEVTLVTPKIFTVVPEDVDEVIIKYPLGRLEDVFQVSYQEF